MRKVPIFVFSSLLSTLAGIQAQTPQNIDGLRLWLDASDAATITSTNGLISQWSDKSGFDNHAVQADPERQPAVGVGALAGRNAVRFDALGAGNFTSNPGDDGMDINPAFSLDRAYTTFLVDQYWGAAAQGRTWTGNVNNWLLGHWNGTESHYTGDFISGNVAAALNQPLFSEAVGTASSNYLHRNFRARGYVNGLVNNPGQTSLGETPSSVWTEASQADVAEVIAFTRALTDTERWQVQDYLSAKYGQPAGLSRAHATRSTVFTGADAGEGLDFQGNFIAAVNAGGPGGFTIGDANFTADTGVTAENHIPNWTTPEFGGGAPSANDTNLNAVMSSIRWSAVDNLGQDDVTVSIPGLVPGNTYKVQMMFNESGTSSRHFAVELENKNIHADYAEGSFRGVDNQNALGNALVHEFVAKDETLNFRLHSTGLTGGDLNQLINGFTVENRGVKGMTTTGTFNSAAQLDLSGDMVYAVAMGGAGGETIGDATFTSEFTGGVAVSAEFSIANWVAGATFGGTAEDMALGSVMSSIRWSETLAAQGGVSIDLEVIPGEIYKLQLLVMEGCCDRGFDIAFEGVRTVDDFNASAMGARLADNTGAVITHTFTAEDEMFNIMLDGYATNFMDKNPVINALTLERIPEPGTAGLTLLAGGLLAFRRRRK